MIVPSLVVKPVKIISILIGQVVIDTVLFSITAFWDDNGQVVAQREHFLADARNVVRKRD